MRRLTYLAATGCAALAIVTVAPASSALATTRSVREGQSIQAAIDRSRPGDTIIVTGSHAENLQITTNRIRLVGRRAELTAPAHFREGRCQPPPGRSMGTAAGICVSHAQGVAVTGFIISGF